MVWDVWVRVGHWLVVALIGFQFFSGGDLDLIDWHAWTGIALLTWVAFRVLWGFVGTRHARFSDFVGSPAQIKSSFRKLTQRQHESVAGHTHAGGLGVIALLGLVALLAITGLFTTDDIIFDGPLSHWVGSDVAGTLTSVHHLLSKLLILTMVGHVVAIAWHQGVMKEPLIQGMLHGRKAGGQEAFGQAVLVRGLLVVGVCALTIVGGLLAVGRF